MIEKKKVLMVANSTFPEGKANSVNVFRMIGSLTRQGHDITLIARRSSPWLFRNIWKRTCRRFGEQPTVRGLFVWWPFTRGAEVVLAFTALFFLIFTKKNTLVFTRIRYVALMGKLFHRSTIFENHAPPGRKIQKKIDAWLLAQPAFQMLVISGEFKEIYAEMGMKADLLKVCPDAGQPSGATLPSRTQFGGKATNLGYIGSLYEGRGFEIIHDLALRMSERQFHVIGNLDTWTPPKSSLPSNILLYDEVTPRQAELMTRLFDILLMPYQTAVKIGNGLDTTRWMSPLKMFEYLHAGRPLISSDLPVLREVLRHRENALLVPPDNLDAWAKAIEELDDPEKRFLLARQAVEDARSSHTWEKRVRGILGQM